MKFSYSKYVSKCLLGGELVYFACLAYGALFLKGNEETFHHAFFNTFPGFSWTAGGIIIGAIFVAVSSWIFGSYMVWMLNSSVEKEK